MRKEKAYKQQMLSVVDSLPERNPPSSVDYLNGVFPPVLDVCCGARMFWFDKRDPRALFVDKRSGVFTYMNGNRNQDYLIDINPDVRVDFRELPFPDNSFSLVVFDPPHLKGLSEGSYMSKKYGTLPEDWEDMIRLGFLECFRVLKPEGVLIFKWNEYSIPLSCILGLTPHKPLFGNKFGKDALTHWVCFLK